MKIETFKQIIAEFIIDTEAEFNVQLNQTEVETEYNYALTEYTDSELDIDAFTDTLYSDFANEN